RNCDLRSPHFVPSKAPDSRPGLRYSAPSGANLWCRIPPAHACLGSDAVGDSVGVEGDWVAQFEPGALAFTHVGHSAGFIGGEFAPGVVAGDDEIFPGRSLQMHHQDVASGIGVYARWTEHFFHFGAVSGSGAINGGYINRTGSFSSLVSEAHGAADIRP